MKHEIRVLGELGSEFERIAVAPLRRWSPLQRWRPLAVALALVLAGSAAGAATLVSEQPSAPPSATVPVPVGARPNAADVRRYDVTVTPNLGGGEVGWCLSAELNYSDGGESGTGTCGAPIKGQPIIAFASGVGYAADASRGRPAGTSGTTTTTIAAMTTPQVAAVRVSPTLTLLTRRDPALPDNYRIAVAIHETATRGAGPHIFFPRTSRGGVPLGAIGNRIGPERPLNWVALDRHGRTIPNRLNRAAQQHPALAPRDTAAYWQTKPTQGVGPQPKLHAPPPAACEIYTTALAGARTSFGEVVRHVHGFPTLVSKTYLSCAFTYLDYHGYGIQAAILLDAQHPGTPPGPLPDSTVVRRNPMIVNTSAGIIGGEPRYITARRVGNAWLLVQSSGPLAVRTAALTALTACVHITRAPCAVHD